MHYTIFYSNDFGQTWELSGYEQILDITKQLKQTANDLSYPTHEWEYDLDDLTVYDCYGNIYKFEPFTN